MATLEAMLAPKQFSSKGKDPEQLLIDFDLYIKTVNNYLLAVEKDDASSKVKLATLQALGGPDMVDLLEHVGKVVLTGTRIQTIMWKLWQRFRQTLMKKV